MIDIYNISVLDLMPPNLKEDPDLVAAAKSLDKEFSITVNQVNKCILLPNVDDITDEKLLDLLAWQTHLDYYDTSLPIETKRELWRNTIYFSSHNK